MTKTFLEYGELRKLSRNEYWAGDWTSYDTAVSLDGFKCEIFYDGFEFRWGLA